MDSFNPAAAAPRPASILLDQRAHIAEYRINNPPDITDNSNATTAVAKSRGGHTMAVTFWMADPPDISFFTVVCSKPPDAYSKSSNFRVVPHVVGAEGRFVLLRAKFFSRYCHDEFFMYKAGDSEPPSLDWVPQPYDEEFRRYSATEFGVVPSGHDGGQYLLAAIWSSPSGYQLRIYSSERKSWSTRALLNPCPGIQMVVPEKVITLGESLLGWVDFSCGMLVCDLRQEPPDLQFIPLPPPLPENREKLKMSEPEDSARCFRDLACVNGVLKFIEIEHRVIPPETPDDPRSKEVLHDSDLMMWLEREYVNEKLKQPPKRDGWSAMTWSRMVSLSTDCWHKECDVDVADLLFDEAAHSSLLSGLRGESETVNKLTFRDLYSTFPTLSTDGSNILYLKSMLEPGDLNVRVISVDLENKTVKALGAYLFEDRIYKKVFRPCSLSHYLNMNPGTEVSVCHDLMISQTCSSANGQNNTSVTSIHVDKPIPSGLTSSGSLLRKLTVHELKLKALRENDHMSQDIPGNSNHVETTRKLQRLIVEHKSHGQGGAQSIVQNMAPALCQVTGIKDSSDSQEIRQSYAEEASCAHEPQIELQSTHLSGGCSMQNKQACCGPHGLWPPLSRSCLPQPKINQLNGVGNRPNTQRLNPLYAASSTGSCVPHPPLQNINHWNGPGNHLHTQEVNQSHWNGAGYHPRPHNFIQNNYNGYNFPWPNLPAYGAYPGHFPQAR